MISLIFIGTTLNIWICSRDSRFSVLCKNAAAWLTTEFDVLWGKPQKTRIVFITLGSSELSIHSFWYNIYIITLITTRHTGVIGRSRLKKVLAFFREHPIKYLCFRDARNAENFFVFPLIRTVSETFFSRTIQPSVYRVHRQCWKQYVTRKLSR